MAETRTVRGMSTVVNRDPAGLSRVSPPLAGNDSGQDPDAARRFLVESRLTAPVRRIWSGLATCLMYHRVCAESSMPEGGFWPNRELFVRESELDSQMRYLAANFNCLSLPDAIRLLRERKLPRNSVVVTFDDGYPDNLTVALPILKTYGIPATVYIATGTVDHSVAAWWYELERIIRRANWLRFEWNGTTRAIPIPDLDRKRECFVSLSRMMRSMNPVDQSRFLRRLCDHPGEWSSRVIDVIDRSQVRTLAREPLITIGAHTHNHPVLSSLTDNQLRVELSSSRRLLEEWTDRAIVHLAYPFGGRKEAGRREFRAARELGFESATTTRLGHLHAFHSTRLFALPRIPVGFGDTMTRFRWKVSGLESLTRRPFGRIAL